MQGILFKCLMSSTSLLVWEMQIITTQNHIVIVDIMAVLNRPRCVSDESFLHISMRGCQAFHEINI